MLIRVLVPHHGGALGEDGDAAFPLQLVAVQRTLGHLLMLPEGAGLAEELVDQGRLAVVDMRDDRDVADVHDGLLGRRWNCPRGHTGVR